MRNFSTNFETSWTNWICSPACTWSWVISTVPVLPATLWTAASLLSSILTAITSTGVHPRVRTPHLRTYWIYSLTTQTTIRSAIFLLPTPEYPIISSSKPPSNFLRRNARWSRSTVVISRSWISKNWRRSLEVALLCSALTMIPTNLWNKCTMTSHRSWTDVHHFIQPRSESAEARFVALSWGHRRQTSETEAREAVQKNPERQWSCGVPKSMQESKQIDHRVSSEKLQRSIESGYWSKVGLECLERDSTQKQCSKFFARSNWICQLVFQV